MLAVLGGKAAPTADDVKGILSSCGIDTDEEMLSKLMSSLEGKDVNELIAEGMTKLSSVPSGGGGGGGGAAGGGAAEAAEETKEEEKEESEDEEDNDMGFDLFD